MHLNLMGGGGWDGIMQLHVCPCVIHSRFCYLKQGSNLDCGAIAVAYTSLQLIRAFIFSAWRYHCLFMLLLRVLCILLVVSDSIILHKHRHLMFLPLRDPAIQTRNEKIRNVAVIIICIYVGDPVCRTEFVVAQASGFLLQLLIFLFSSPPPCMSEFMNLCVNIYIYIYYIYTHQNTYVR